jgi:hypothetical protein
VDARLQAVLGLGTAQGRPRALKAVLVGGWTWAHRLRCHGGVVGGGQRSAMETEREGHRTV